jgi:protein-disulfide isomerase
MRGRTLIALLAGLAAVAAAGPGFAQRARARAPAAGPVHDWTQTAVRTPEGGFRIGNPNAPVKLVEYLSLTCSHCADFAHEGSDRLLQQYVRPGRVSVEYRNYVLNAYDLAAAFLSRCAAPRAYFAMSDELLTTQPRWMGRMQALTDAQRAQLRGLAPLQAMQRIVALLGLDAVAARHGIAPVRQRACLADQAGLDRIGTMHQAAETLGVGGTPTFFLNGRMLNVNTWAAVEPLLRAR